MNIIIDDINQEDLEAAAEFYDSLVKGDFYEKEEEARQWMKNLVKDGLKVGEVASQ